MITKYHNHTLQTNPRRREEETQNTVTRHPKDNKSKATSSLFLVKIFAKLEWTKSNAYLTKTNTEHPQTM